MEAVATDDSTPPPLHLHGDMLECVLQRVPPDELAASAALVSSDWRRAARALDQPQRGDAVVSLVAHVQGATVGRLTHVYDPRSRTWASDDKAPAHLHVLPVRRCACAGGDRIYTLSLASMAISVDALGVAWRELPPPRVWRVDPVVATVGARVVVLGGACGAMARAGVVEVADCDDDDGHDGWATCSPMPAPLAPAPSGSWVSAAASERRVYMVARRTGWASWFDPSTRQWGQTRQFQRPSTAGDVKSWALCGVSRGDERVLVVAAGSCSSSDSLRVVLWSVGGETLLALEELGTAEMPAEMAEKLFGGGAAAAAAASINIGAVAAGSTGRYRCGGYVYNASEPNKGAAMYELKAGHAHEHELTVGVGEKKKPSVSSRWAWLPCPPAAREGDPPPAIVFGSLRDASVDL